MSKCKVGSGGVERPLKLWSLIIQRVQCGGGGIQRPRRKKAAEAKKQGGGSERLSELLKEAEWWENEEEEEVRRKEQALEGLKKVAKKLQQQQSGSMEVVIEAAAEVRRLAKDDPHARTTLALLGVIPPLVGLLDHSDPSSSFQIPALYALLNLAISNDVNKAAIVKAGAVHKMLKLIFQSPNGVVLQQQQQVIAEAVVANFLGLSALDSNKLIIGSSGAIPFLVQTLRDVDKNVSCQAKQDSLRALYNLSILPSNVLVMLETNLIPHLFVKLEDMDMSERVLSVLSNVVSVAEGRKGIRAVRDAFPILIDIFNWIDSPGCQEKASYILMVMAHKSYGDRQAMIEAGIVSSLLELTLLGSTLAQKRASRMLECLRMEKGKQVCGGGSLPATLSAPLLSGRVLSLALSSVDPASYKQKEPLKEEEPKEVTDDEDGDGEMMSQERKAVKQLVQQSLQNNMRRMVKRANLPHDFVPSDHLKALTSSSTSKSLPLPF